MMRWHRMMGELDIHIQQEMMVIYIYILTTVIICVLTRALIHMVITSRAVLVANCCAAEALPFYSGMSTSACHHWSIIALHMLY